MGIKDLTDAIIGCAMKVHTFLGPGLLESAYQICLAHECSKQGLKVEREVPIPIKYDTITLECGFRADLVVEKMVLLELKSVVKILPIHEAQLLSYLRLSHYPLGLLMNFGELHLKNGIKRIINTKRANSCFVFPLRTSLFPFVILCVPIFNNSRGIIHETI